MGTLSGKKIVSLVGAFLFVFLWLEASPSQGHVGIPLNIRVILTINDSSISMDYFVDCGKNSGLYLLPVMDLNGDGDISLDEVEVFNTSLQEHMEEHLEEHLNDPAEGCRLRLDGDLMALIPTSISSVVDGKDNEDIRIRILSILENLTFSTEGHRLTLANHPCGFDFELLEELLGMERQHEHDTRAHEHRAVLAPIVHATVRAAGSIIIDRTSEGFITEKDGRTVVEGIFLSKGRAIADIFFRVSK